jgi:arylsulfatase A-like enzyme
MNVIVIVLDSLRADHVGCYGSRIRTPSLDAFATESALFTQAISESLPTLPCRTTWWTGRAGFPFRPWQQFEHSDVLLAEVLWDQGYTSALVSDVYHMHKPVYNCGRGFDTVAWVRGQEYDPWIVDPRIPVDLSRHRLRGDESDALWQPRFEQYLRNMSVVRGEEDYFCPRVMKEAMRWLDEQVIAQRRKDHLFLWIDSFDPHEPWDPPDPWRTMYDPDYTGQELIDPVPGDIAGYLTPREVEHIKALYAGEVTFVDKWVGVFLQRVRDLGLYENSLIMITSDHGEPLGEHGYIRKARPENHEQLVHIPWLIRHPQGWGAGQRLAALAQPTDMLPTIMDCLGLPLPLQQTFRAPTRTMFPQDMPIASTTVELHGVSLLPLLRGEAETVRDYAYSGHYGRQWAIRDAQWAYLLNIDGSAPPQLYDRQRDPAEQHNLVAERAEVAAALELQLRRWVASLR